MGPGPNRLDLGQLKMHSPAVNVALQAARVRAAAAGFSLLKPMFLW